MKTPAFDAAVGAITLTLVLGSAAPAAWADDAPLEQAKTQARRAQQALQQAQADLQNAQAQVQTLQAENAKLKAQAEQGDKAQAGWRAAKAEASMAEHRAQSCQASVGHAQSEASDTKQQLAQSQEKAQADLTKSQAALADQQRVASSLATLLARSTDALAKAEEANHKLYDLGLQAAQSRAQSCAADSATAAGFQNVRLQDEADQLRKQMNALRVAKP